jgi:AhpD family alkylhydroperoxidase
METYRKRFLHTPCELLRAMGAGTTAILGAIGTRREHRVSPAFAEKLMLAVSGVNACTFCSYRHTRTALEQGVTEDEIRALLAGDVSGFAADEAVGIAYAQHWAESRGRPSAVARERAVDSYGEDRVRNMEVFMRMVELGNLCSNTVEAYRRGVRVEGARARFYLTYLGCFPIAAMIRRSGRRPGGPPMERELEEIERRLEEPRG